MKILKKEDGISLIVTVIAVMIVVAEAMVFDDSTKTIERASYSKFVSNIGEVRDAIQVKKTEVKNNEMSEGSVVTNAQVYNYIAKGGKSKEDFLEDTQVPDYTVIEENADIGTKLPEIKVYYTSKNEGEKVTYAVTKDGDVFIWPPYEYDNEYYVNIATTVDKELAGKKGEFTIKISEKDIKIKTDESGKLINE